jgi:hypothetical protein
MEQWIIHQQPGIIFGAGCLMLKMILPLTLMLLDRLLRRRLLAKTRSALNFLASSKLKLLTETRKLFQPITTKTTKIRPHMKTNKTGTYNTIVVSGVHFQVAAETSWAEWLELLSFHSLSS